MKGIIDALSKTSEGQVMILFGGLILCAGIAGLLFMAGYALMLWAGYTP